jgi:hypothetical protein
VGLTARKDPRKDRMWVRGKAIVLWPLNREKIRYPLVIEKKNPSDGSLGLSLNLKK